MQSHFFHGQWHVIDFQDLVVVSGNDSVERIAYEAETEVTAAKTSGLLRCNELRFTVSIFAPEPVRRGLDPTGGFLIQKFAKRGLDRGVGHLGNSPVQKRDVTKQDEVSR